MNIFKLTLTMPYGSDLCTKRTCLVIADFLEDTLTIAKRDWPDALEYSVDHGGKSVLL